MQPVPQSTGDALTANFNCSDWNIASAKEQVRVWNYARRPRKVLCKWGSAEGTLPAKPQSAAEETFAIIFSTELAVIFERTCQYNLISDTHKYSALERKQKLLPHSRGGVCVLARSLARSHYFLRRAPTPSRSLQLWAFICALWTPRRKTTPWISPRDFWTLFAALSQPLNRRAAPWAKRQWEAHLREN